MAYYLASASGHLFAAAPTPHDALTDYLVGRHLSEGVPEDMHSAALEVSLGVGFAEGDPDQPVFVVGAPGAFIDCTAGELDSWADWYELDWLETVFEFL